MEPEKLSTSLLDLDQEAEQKKNIKHNKTQHIFVQQNNMFIIPKNANRPSPYKCRNEGSNPNPIE